MSVSDDRYAELMREILLAEPYRGVCLEPSKILDHVYIGSQSNAESLRLLRQLGITHVLNCAGYKGPRPIPNASPYEGLGIDYYEFQAEDTDTYEICQHFPEAFDYLDRVKRHGGIALVHCALGINRSAAVCLGYLMMHSKIPLLEATRIMKNKRRIVLANRAFQRQLVRFARMRGRLDRAVTESGLEEESEGSSYGIKSYLNRDRSGNDFIRGSTRSKSHSNRYLPVDSDHVNPHDLSLRFRQSLRTSDGEGPLLEISTGLGVESSLKSRPFSMYAPGSSRSMRNDERIWRNQIGLDRKTVDDLIKSAAMGSGSRSTNDRSRSIIINKPIGRRAQSTPRLTDDDVSSVSGRHLNESYAFTRPVEFRY